MSRFLIVRLGSLGDLVHMLPAVAAIRRAHPDAEIDWLVDGVHADFLALVPVITRVIPLGGRTAGAWIAARRVLAARRYDIALDFQGLVKSAALARLSGARRVIGFNARALRERLASVFYTEQVDVPDGRHVVYKNLALSAVVGAHADALEFPLAPVESPALAVLRAAGVERFALINPGGAWPNKRWPPERFGAIAQVISARHQLRSVVVWGPGERGLAEAVVAASGEAATIAPPTGLADLVALSRAAALIVSGDTGPLHIALAVGTAAVALFGPTDPARNGPWRTEDIALSRYGACQCHYQRACRRGASPCLDEISIDDVTEAVSRRLAQT
jgi:lipopolysaccharide heptosyltransferase I